MLRGAVKVPLATNGAIVLSRGLLQVDAEPRTLCNVDGPDILDNARPVCVGLDPLTNLEI